MLPDEIRRCVHEVADRLGEGDDPVQGRWMIDSSSIMNVWADASNMAVGAVLEVDGDIVEDGAWLRGKQDTAQSWMQSCAA